MQRMFATLRCRQWISGVPCAICDFLHQINNIRYVLYFPVYKLSHYKPFVNRLEMTVSSFILHVSLVLGICRIKPVEYV